MVVTFLGTGTSQGVPVIGCECNVCTSLDFRDKRLRTSVHIQSDEASVVIDTGPDFRQQMLREKVKTLDAVVFTHEHKDHIAGLDEVRAFNYKQRAAIPFYAEPRVIRQIKTEFAYAFSEPKYPGVPDITPVEVIDQPFKIKDLTFEPIRVYHYKLPVLGYRVGNFTYITDANAIPEADMQKVKGSEIIVLNGLQTEPHISHFTLAEAIEVLEELNPREAYLTHISHKLGQHSEVEKKLPSFIKLAFDGQRLTI